MVDKFKLTNTLRREKSANYTRDEKHLLLDKITPFLDIIENKKTDSVTVEAKTRAWMQVTSNYNAANPRGTRKINQLKNLFENLKKRVKKDIIADREEFRQRGVRPTNGRIDDVGWRLIKLLPRLKILYTCPDSAQRTNTDSEAIKQHFTVTVFNKDSSDRTSIDTTVDEVQFNIKEEILHDAIDLEQLPEAYCTEDNNIHHSTTIQNVENQIDQVEDNAMEIVCFAKQSTATQTEEMLEIEKEIKRKEIDKLNLEIQMKQLEVEYMRAKLREQELQVKFKEMEYQIKYKELIK